MAITTSSSSATNSATPASPLLAKIPAELRNRVYHLALHARDKIEISPAGLKGRMALLQTCKQVREEAIGIFFSENSFKFTFILGATNLLATWMDTMGGKSIRLVQDVTMDVDVPTEQWDQFLDRLNHVLEVGLDGGEDLNDAWEILKLQSFGVHVIAMVESIKAKPIDSACVQIGEGVGQSEATRRIASALCGMVRHLIRAEARSREELIAALPYGKKVLNVLRD